jgi:hypothetical protein
MYMMYYDCIIIINYIELTITNIYIMQLMQLNMGLYRFLVTWCHLVCSQWRWW